jgi:hypothetical protein
MMNDFKNIPAFADCKAITGLKQKCQVISGQRKKIGKEILGRDNVECKMQAYIYIYGLHLALTAKKLKYNYFVISKKSCNFEPKLHADKRRSTSSQNRQKRFFAKS